MKPYNKMVGEPTTVEKLEARLRSLIPRLGSRDRQIVLDGIQAIRDLAAALLAEQQANAKTTVRYEEPMRLQPIVTEGQRRHANGDPV